jgi:hypothetical protein
VFVIYNIIRVHVLPFYSYLLARKIFLSSALGGGGAHGIKYIIMQSPDVPEIPHTHTPAVCPSEYIMVYIST